MNEQSDLRVYIETLLKHWRIIVGVTVLGAIVALAVSLLQPAKYEATAIVLVTNPVREFQLSADEPGATNTQPPLSGRAALGLATNDALLQRVLAQVGSELPSDKRNLYSLRKMLKARTGGDASVINLSATTEDAERSALLANTWAELYVQQVNALYGKGPDQSQFYAEQLAEARTDVEKAEQALVEFQKGSDLGVLEAQLAAKQRALSEYLSMNESLVLLQQDVDNLQARLASRPAGSSSNLGDELAQLILQVSVLSTRSSLPVQLQMPGTSALTERSAAEQAEYLAELARTIEARQTETRTQTDALLPEIKTLQGRIEEVRTEADRLERERDLAQDVHSALALKARETSITAQAASGSVRMVSSAAAPDRPLSRRLVLFTVAGMILGLLLGAAAAFGMEYFRAPAPRSFTAKRDRKTVLPEATQ